MNNNDTALFAVPTILLVLLLLLLSFSSPSVTTMAQQITAATTQPLTPQEQEQQIRLQNVIAATNQNLDEAEKEVNGIVFTPRWSNPIWVEPNSLSILFAYCLPGEFAESGQEILGGFELEVLESYEIALAQGFMAWMMVVGNEGGEQNRRLPAAVGVICASDLNDVQTRVLSPQEQQQINNVVQQFITTTQVTNIEQVTNIINNITTNATTGGGPVTPPAPSPPTNATGDTTPPVFAFPTDATDTISSPEGERIAYFVAVRDNVDGIARLEVEDKTPDFARLDITESDIILVQDDIGGSITISCNPPPASIFPVGVTTVQCTATDASGNTGTHSATLTLEFRPDTTPPNLYIEVGPPSIPLPTPYTIETNDPQGIVRYHVVAAGDDVDGEAVLDPDNNLVQMDDMAGNITISCDPPSPYLLPVGDTRVECTAVDQAGNAATKSFTITVELSPFSPPGALVGNTTAAAPAIEEEAPAEEQPPPPTADEEEEAPVQEEEQPPTPEEQPPPAAEEEEATTTSPPANEGGE